MLPLVGGLFLGWAIGANDAANVFGTAVASKIIKFRNAAILCGICVIVGAVVQGNACIQTLSCLSQQNSASLLVATIAAGLTVLMMIGCNLSISASQAIIGAVAGIGLTTGTLNWSILNKVIISWVATPIGAFIIVCIVYNVLGFIMSRMPMSMLTRDKILWAGLLIVGAYGSYALGANNVANAVGIFSGQIANLSDKMLSLIGGGIIAFGVISYGKRMMTIVGNGLMRLDAFTAFTAVFSMAITVHIFAFIGVPVSARQAIVGAIIGIGFMRGMHTIRINALKTILAGWLLTPLIAMILSSSVYAIVSAGTFSIGK